MSRNVFIGAPHMTGSELVLFERILSGSSRYLEFGIGGSSLLAVRKGVKTIVSVESDLAWARAVRSHAEIAPRIADKSMVVLHGNVGPVGAWGTPKGQSSLHLWPNYIAVAWAEWAQRCQMPDLVFVDGRFRVACCMAVVIASGAGRRLTAPRVLLHDVVEQRPRYRKVFEFFDVEESIESMYCLRVRSDADPLRALSRFLQEQFDVG